MRSSYAPRLRPFPDFLGRGWVVINDPGDPWRPTADTGCTERAVRLVNEEVKGDAVAVGHLNIRFTA